MRGIQEKWAVMAALFFGSTLALNNASPVMLISNSKPLEISESEQNTFTSMDYVFNTLAPDAIKDCEYDTYIFLKHNSVSERHINSKSMPFLTQTLDRAKGKYVSGVSLEFEDGQLDQIASEIIDTVEKTCSAATLTLNPAQEDSPIHYADLKPRVISGEFSEKSSAKVVDDAIKRLVGNLPSKNFFLAYYSTPVKASQSDITVITPPVTSNNETANESVLRKYQFFSPALFMGFITTGLLITVFIIALNAVSSLQISTAAFEAKRQPPKRKS